MSSSIGLRTAITSSDIDAINKAIPDFPSDKLRRLFNKYNVPIYDVDQIPKSFSKYFAVMNWLAGGNLKGKSLLDVGSGLGVFVSQGKLLGMNSTGIDIFIEYQGACQQGAMCVYEAYGNSFDNAQRAFISHDITECPAPRGKYDFVTSFGMLEHIYGKEKRQNVIHNMMKSLAKGGSLILTCGPNEYFPIDLHHYGPKFVLYHCLPLWARGFYLRAFAKSGQCMDPKWLNGMRVAEIKRHILEVEPDACIAQAFPLWVSLANSRWMQRFGIRRVVTGVAAFLSMLNMEPVIILVVTKVT